MRLNKMRLAAAMMSAVMAASTMSTAVFAEDLLIEDVAVEEQVEAAAVSVKSVKISKEGVVTVTFDDGTEDTTTYKATKTVKAATCTEAEKIMWDTVVGGIPYRETFDGITALGHQSDGVRLVDVITPSTCKVAGEGRYYTTCKVCGEKIYENGTVSLPLAEHIAGDPVTEYVPVSNISIEEGVPVLDDPSQDGTYNEVVTTKCKECKEILGVPKVTPKTILATEMKVAAQRVETLADSNIATNINGKKPEEVKDAALALVDCTKDGYYNIVSYSDKECTKVISKDRHVVAAHHLEKIVNVVKDSKEAGLLADVKDDDGNVIGAKSLSCFKEVKYYEKVVCAAENDKVLSKTEKVAQPAGPHISDTVVKTAVTTAKNEVEASGILSVNTYIALKSLENTSDYIKVVAKDTCETDGTVTITSYCTACGKEIETVTLKVRKLDHQYGATKEENKVPATCSEAGSYDVVKYCDVCGKREVVRTGVIIPQISHTYAKDGSGIGVEFVGSVVVDSYTGSATLAKNQTKALGTAIGVPAYSVTAKAYDTCTVCGEKVYNAAKATAGTGSVKVVDVKAQSVDGTPGSIILNATYTVATTDNKTKKVTTGDQTFAYYTNLIAYLDRNPGKVINGLHEDTDGTWRYYKDGIFQKDFSGIAEYNGAEFFVANGVLCSEATGLNLYNGTWYMLVNGQIQRGYTGLALYDGAWFYLTNGELDVNVNELVSYDGQRFAVAAGRLLDEVNGLWQNPKDGEWYFLALGRAVEEYTGTATYDGRTFELVNGKLVG